METFDQPENSVSCPRRDTSIVAPQALSLLNGPLAVRAARALAERVRREAGTKPDDQMDRLFQLVLQRPPALEEREASRTFLNSRSLAELSRAMLNVNEFIFVD
jgi:hypothetical protein